MRPFFAFFWVVFGLFSGYILSALKPNSLPQRSAIVQNPT